ncbi:MAG: DNA mismatch repair endonuclease MutL [Defluviitaleaceae bacterium]|nr:DNA mismatch repair endonuclease MutL [Defluviitaleaceae bacterium]
MRKIIQLDRHLINKIAAGEVVERPLSVVKELTENAIDAGASVITVEIRDGGLSMIRVTDNGTGISPENLPLAFVRHATSKIADFDDLMRVQTLGFRGEALSSIAAVSQVEVLTKVREETAGMRVEVHGGQLLSSKEAGCADGTTIIVSNLFFNTPARRKFLKKPASEAGYVAHCLERLALANPALTLRYINNGQIVFQTSGNGDLKAAVLNVYGREFAVKTIGVDALDADAESCCLRGLAGKPEIARGNRRHGCFFINGRYVESPLISRAIEAAYKTMLPSGKFPVYVLGLTLPPTDLDVNVHPTKMDVRFADEERIFAFIENAVRDALEENNLIPAVRFGGGEKIGAGSVTTRTDLSGLRKAPPLQKFEPITLALREERGAASAKSATCATSEVPSGDLGKKNFFTDYVIHGLVFQIFWLVSQGESLYIIDRHAAHERVLYENILCKSQEERVPCQQLLVPISLRLTPREQQILHDNKEIFAKFGFEIGGEFDRPEIISVPLLMKGPLSAAFFTDILDKMGEVGFVKNSPYTHKTEIVAMAACKAAVKAGDAPIEAEARELVEQLLRLENPFTCPHGRPTIIEITKNELARRFKR